MAQFAAEVPAPRTTLIGRERELATMRDIFTRRGRRLLTVTGVGGGGKTRLALQFAAEMALDYPRRTWLVELAGVAAPSLLPISVASALGLSGAIETTVVDALTAYLHPQPSLLILDNCEHLVDACASLAEQLLAACPELRILATSREPLQIASERQYRLPTLESPDLDQSPSTAEIAESLAVRLFVACGQDVAPAFGLTPENAPIVARVCTRLGGIPLALELAAVRVRVLGSSRFSNDWMTAFAC